MKLKKTIAIAAITAALCSGCTVSNYQNGGGKPPPLGMGRKAAPF